VTAKTGSLFARSPALAGRARKGWLGRQDPLAVQAGMKIIHGIHRIRKFPAAVVALGVFDGVHRAHQRILREAARSARRAGVKSIALTFNPHPQQKESIYSLQHRLRLIASLGIDAAVVIEFTPAFSRLSAENFLKKIILDKIGARQIFVGKNFRFGKGARGDYRLLREFSRRYHFRVKAFPVMKIQGVAISSSYIRRLISQGRLKSAERLLSRRVTVLGTVVKGSRLGRIIGFPTANINPHHEVLPPAGIYAVKIIYRDKSFKGACYIGTKPTFVSAPGKRVIEVHIFDFQKKIYGEDIEIQFIKKLRNDKKFASIAALAAAIKNDLKIARLSFTRH
jgi:riboflavin kinase/FMN adenylyltransferase